MNHITEKDWGQQCNIFATSHFAIDRCHINEGGKSSYGRFHKHLNKGNLFFLEYGKLKIETKTRNGEITEKILSEDSGAVSYLVKAGIWHRFIALEESVVYEIYFANCRSDDIVREELRDA